MSTPPGDPHAYRDGDGWDYGDGWGYGDGGDYGDGAGAPYGVPPQYGAPQYPVPPQYGAPQYPVPPQYGTVPAYGAMQPYAPGYPAAGYPVSRREPAISLALSFFLPGLGTIVNGDSGKGVAIMGGYLLGVLLSIVLVGIPIMMGFWIWGLVDGYRGAQRHNARHGIR